MPMVSATHCMPIGRTDRFNARQSVAMCRDKRALGETSQVVVKASGENGGLNW